MAAEVGEDGVTRDPNMWDAANAQLQSKADEMNKTSTDGTQWGLVPYDSSGSGRMKLAVIKQGGGPTPPPTSGGGNTPKPKAPPKPPTTKPPVAKPPVAPPPGGGGGTGTPIAPSAPMGGGMGSGSSSTASASLAGLQAASPTPTIVGYRQGLGFRQLPSMAAPLAGLSRAY